MTLSMVIGSTAFASTQAKDKTSNGKGKAHSSALDALVTAGTITQAQEDVIVSAIANSKVNTKNVK